MIYVLSDIHGNKQAFNSILNQINLNKDDTLYILGDVIDESGLDILLDIINMDNARVMLGNHEYMMIKALEGSESHLQSWYKRRGQSTHEEFNKLSNANKDKILNYLKTLPLACEVSVNGKNYLLTHCNGATTLALRDNVISFTRVEPNFEVLGDYTLIFGHTPTKYYQPEINPLEVYYGNKMIGIDCGAHYNENSDYKGRLACIRLDDMKVFYSK